MTRWTRTAAGIVVLAGTMAGGAFIALPANAATVSDNSAVSVAARRHVPKPTPTPTPSPTPSQPTAASLQPGAAPSSVPAGTSRVYLGVSFGISGPVVPVSITTSGRYTVEYDSTLPAAFNTIVDGVRLAQTGAGSNAVVYSQTFFLAAGQHTITLGGPEIYGPAQAYLDGPLG